MDCEQFVLTNGLRIVYIEDKTIPTVHCGLMVNAGSRDERAKEHGLAHLIEHCLFKGTKNRRAFHILTRLDSVGGEINAYTTKEETCIYSSSLSEHFDRSAELIADIVFHSTFPRREIEKEKSVVIDEINSYKESPDEMLLDEFESQLYPKSLLGRSILGTKASVSKFSENSIAKFVDRLYTTDQMVFAVVGNVSSKKLIRFCKKHLETIPRNSRKSIDRNTPSRARFEIQKNKSVHQLHAIIGGSTIGLNSEKRRTMVLLNNLLGGPALNSRLNMNIRERMGYCYYIESNYTPYSDTGLFQIYFGTDAKHADRTSKLVQKELLILMDKPLSDKALNAAKKQLLGQMALSQEQRSNLMLSLAKSVLHFNRVDTYDQIQEKVNTITGADVQQMAIDTFQPKDLSTLIYAPRKKSRTLS